MKERVVYQSDVSHLTVCKEKIVTHFDVKRALTAAAEVHDAILCPPVGDIIDSEHSFAG